MSVKINRFELENVKRIKAVKIEPSPKGLTVIGGKNNQGKTSVIDSLAWALGGERYKPSSAARDGSVTPPNMRVVMSNGLVVERKGKNSSLKVIDPKGNKGGQQLLNGFIEELALNLPKFMQATSKEKASILLQIIGVGDQLQNLERQEKEVYNERLMVGRDADRKKKYADEMVYYADAPKDLISASELIQQQQAILARNGENARKREKVDQYAWELDQSNRTVAALEKQLEDAKAKQAEAANNLAIARKDAMDLQDESTEELERNIADVEQVNIKVRANLDKEKAEEDAKRLQDEYEKLTGTIEKIREQKITLLNNAYLPLPELSVQDGEITYKGQKWDNMSGSEQLKVATAIVRELNPECGFVFIDKLEQMDIETMEEFGKWLENEGLQAIATRVSTGDECSIIIEDGYVKEDHIAQQTKQDDSMPAWKGGWK